MKNDYYKKRIMIATCDKQGNITGKIERWEAHEKGVLHRALSLAIIYKGQYLLQHRKHPVFDGVYDITSSSHQIMNGGKLEDTLKACERTLFREWKIKKSDIVGKMKIRGAIYYKAKDPNSIYTEHEYCDIVEVKVKRIPEPNYEVAYGVSLATKKELANKKSRIYSILSPWTIVALEKNLL